MNFFYWSSYLLFSFICGCLYEQAGAGTFEVDYVNNRFLKDGQPFRYISGEIHYFRIHPNQWNDRLKRVRALGLNVIQVYAPWNLHEPTPGNFDFTGGLDIAHFFKLAQQNQLYVNLRAGPYICAEWENGGLPWWLLKDDNIKMRTNDANFTAAVTRYYSTFLSIIKPLLYQNGGPIIMVQVENEYGSFYACDRSYTAFLRDLFKSLLGNDAVLYTTDGAGEGYLKCGWVPNTFTTVDFGVNSDSGIDHAFALQKNYSKGGPSVCSEYYPGWFVMWGQTSQGLPSPQQVVPNLAYMYAVNASFSIYMIHGGTNFGFQNGAETSGPIVTSYDYGAPITESGDITPMYRAIHGLIQNLTDWNWFQCGVNLTKSAIDSLTPNFFDQTSSQLENSDEKTLSQPGVYFGQFNASVIQDTFFNSSGWGKGQLFINGFNVGRYWPVAGPQITLYVPSPIIQQQNTVLLIELIGTQQPYVSFVNQTIYTFH